MARILLVNPPHSFDGKIDAITGYVPPLGLLYLNEILQRAGHSSWVLDMDTEEVGLKGLLALIGRFRFEVVGISVFTRTRRNSYLITREIKARYHNVFLMLGGPHCTIAPEEAFYSSFADLIVSGEAEKSIIHIVEKRPAGIVRVEAPSRLDQLPVPMRDPVFIDNKKYGNLYEIKFADRTSVISSSRGCPYNCSFCLRVGLLRYRERAPERVVDELYTLYQKGYRGVIFNDDNFLANPRRAIQIARLIVKRGIKLDLAMQGSPVPNQELWCALKEAGFVVACVGVEHIVPSILRYFNKCKEPYLWPETVCKTAELMQNQHIISVGSFILGAPMERPRDAYELINFLSRSNFDLLNGNELLFSYKTRLWQDAVAGGLISKNTYHANASDLMPEKNTYVADMFELAWHECIKKFPHTIMKLLISHKRDKIAPLVSILRWLWKRRLRLNRARPRHGYGQLVEV